MYCYICKRSKGQCTSQSLCKRLKGAERKKAYMEGYVERHGKEMKETAARHYRKRAPGAEEYRPRVGG